MGRVSQDEMMGGRAGSGQKRIGGRGEREREVEESKWAGIGKSSVGGEVGRR